MIPYSTKDAVKIVDMVNATNVNASRYSLLANDLSLSASFSYIQGAMSCYDMVTSMYSTVASHSGIWSNAVNNFVVLSTLVRTINNVTPATNGILPVWSATNARQLDAIDTRSLSADFDIIPTVADLNNPLLNWQYRIPSVKTISNMLTGSTEYGLGGKTICRQEYDLSLYPATCGVVPIQKDDIAIWKSTTEHIIGRGVGINLSSLVTAGGVVGIPTADYSELVANVGYICHNSAANTLNTKAIVLNKVGAASITSAFSITTENDRMVFAVDTNTLFSALVGPSVTLGAYNSAHVEIEDGSVPFNVLIMDNYYNNITSETVPVSSGMSFFPYGAQNGSGILTVKLHAVTNGGYTFGSWFVVSGPTVTFTPNATDPNATATYNINSGLKVKIGAALA